MLRRMKDFPIKMNFHHPILCVERKFGERENLKPLCMIVFFPCFALGFTSFFPSMRISLMVCLSSFIRDCFACRDIFVPFNQFKFTSCRMISFHTITRNPHVYYVVAGISAKIKLIVSEQSTRKIDCFVPVLCIKNKERTLCVTGFLTFVHHFHSPV